MVLSKEDFMKKLAALPEDKATEEEMAIFAQADKERANGTYDGIPLEEYRK